MPDAIAAVREAFIAVAEGRADQPQRLASRDGRALAMLTRVQPGDDTVFKVVTITPENRTLGRSSVHAVAVWVDGSSGRPLALIEGSTLTALRTGAASGVATQLFAPSDARVLALIGAGGQAADQVDAVCAVREIAEIRIASRSGTTAEALAQRLAEQRPGVRVTAVATAREAVMGADVVCCATTSTTPLFAFAELAENVHVNAIGSYTASMCELEPRVLSEARIVAVDELSAALAEAGDVIQAIDAGALAVEQLRQIGELVLDRSRPDGTGVTVFKSVGIASQDWAVARLAFERAAERPDLLSVHLGAADEDVLTTFDPVV